MRNKLFILGFLLVMSQSCAKKPGIFAFYPVDMSVLTPEQKIWFQPTDFRRFNQPVFFKRHHTIWYSYKPDSPKFKKPYAISLLKKSLGYIEIDLRNQVIKNSAGFLVDRYDNLETGFYKIKIAVDNEVIDFFDFEIIESSDSDVIDYELSLDNPEAHQEDVKFDDIRALSK